MSMVRAQYRKLAPPLFLFGVLEYPQKHNQTQHGKSTKVKTNSS